MVLKKSERTNVYGKTATLRRIKTEMAANTLVHATDKPSTDPLPQSKQH